MSTLYPDRPAQLRPMDEIDPLYNAPWAPRSNFHDEEKNPLREDDTFCVPTDLASDALQQCIQCKRVTHHENRVFYTKTNPTAKFSDRIRHQHLICTECGHIAPL